MKQLKMLLSVPLVVLAGCQPEAGVPTAEIVRTTEAEVVETTAAPEPTETQTPEQAKAVEDARAILPMSRDGLFEQLTRNYGYDLSVAAYAVDHIEADWDEQAAKVGVAWLELYGGQMTLEELEESLIESQFTSTQAAHGSEQAMVEWEQMTAAVPEPEPEPEPTSQPAAQDGDTFSMNGIEARILRDCEWDEEWGGVTADVEITNRTGASFFSGEVWLEVLDLDGNYMGEIRATPDVGGLADGETFVSLAHQVTDEAPGPDGEYTCNIIEALSWELYYPGRTTG